MSIGQFLRVTSENVYRTFDLTTPDYQFYVPLENGNVFTPREQPIRGNIRDFNGSNGPRVRFGKRKGYVGELSGTLYSAKQAKWLIQSACQKINALKTLPWPTDQCPDDLCSFSMDHAIMTGCGTYERSRYLGGKVVSLELTGAVSDSNDATAERITYRAQLMFSEKAPAPDAVAFPEPALSVLPKNAFVFQDTDLVIGTARTNYKAIGLSINNTLAPQFFAGNTVSRMTLKSRQVALTATHLLMAAPNDRADYENDVKKVASLTISDGTNSILFDLLNNNYFDAIGDQLDLDNDFFQELNLTNYMDPDTGNDFAVSFTGFAA